MIFTLFLKRFLIFFISLILLVGVGGCMYIPYYIKQITKDKISENSSDIKPTRVALVFGAGVTKDGTLSAMLADRVDAAIALYKMGSVQKLVMTGDNSSVDYDEVSNMRRYAVAREVPLNDITLDYAGFNTFDSCYRAKHIFGVDEAVLITQAYHQPRAVYTCKSLGIAVQGYALPDWQKYPQKRFLYSVREYAAQIKAWIQVHTPGSKAQVLGRQEKIE